MLVLSNINGLSKLFSNVFISLIGDKLEIPYLKNDTIDISENDYLNLTFWLDVSQCNMSNTLYALTMKIHTVTKSPDQDERIQITNNTCTLTPTKSIRCISSNGPVEIFRKVNRSHDEIGWKWRWKYNQSFKEHSKAVKLNVRCTYTLNCWSSSIEVRISCSY